MNVGNHQYWQVIEVPINTRHVNAEIPEYQTEGASGFDLVAAIDEPLYVFPLSRGYGGATIPLGLEMAIPVGYELQVRPRSGLAFKHDILAHFGTIDSDFRGEIKVRLWNLGSETFVVQPGARIAQGVLAPVPRAVFVDYQSEDLPATERGAGGLGHTGV